MAGTLGVQLNAIERKNLLKMAEQLYRATHCECDQWPCAAT